MDNNTVYTLTIPLLCGVLFGYIHHFNHLYVSNTKMIIRQSDQIQFLLTRIIELENKIKKNNSYTSIAQDECEYEDDVVAEDECDEDDVIAEDDCDDDVIAEDDCHDDVIAEEECDDDVVTEGKKEKDFELVEKNATFKISKNNGWLRFIF
jgi:hypothetical protein